MNKIYKENNIWTYGERTFERIKKSKSKRYLWK